MAKGPSPRDEAARRASKSRRGWEAADEDEPWLDEGDYERDGPTHTLVGRSTLMWILGTLAVLALGVIVGLLLVSRREDSPIDVPQVGEDVPVLKNPGQWKAPPAGTDVEGIPVEGQGQVLFGTGEGRDVDARIDVDTLPEDPLDKPGPAAAPASEEDLANRPAPLPPKVILPEAQRQQAQAAQAAPPPPAPAPAPVQPQPVAPKAVAPPPRPATAPATQPTASGAAIQLGAFSSRDRALSAFKTMSARFAYLAALEPSVAPTTRDGQTLYRLRVPAGSAAAARDLCNRLKLAGEACSVVD